MKLRAVLFDLDGTIRHNQPHEVDTFHRWAAELGVPVSPERSLAAGRWLHAYLAQSDELLDDDRAVGGQRNGAFWRRQARRHLEILGARPDDAEVLSEAITARFEAEYRPQDVVPPDVAPSLNRLRGTGYRLGLVSNRREPLDGLLAELGLGDAFDFAVAAGEVGWWKPDRRLFVYAAERAGVRPEQAAYVGDNLFADIQGARGAGLHPLLLDPAGLFPEADCPVVRSVAEVPPALARLERAFSNRRPAVR
ncbi:MAG: HAD family hydrolase [Anaerolineales bacterium]